MNKTIIGIFADTSRAEDTISELEAIGLDPKDMSLLMKDKGEAKVIGDHTGAHVAGGAAGGIATGAVLGGLTGFLIATGTLLAPAVGALFIAGPLAGALGLTGVAATTLSGAATGALAGGILGILIGFGLSESEARVYEKHITEGGVLVAVAVPNDIVGKVKDTYKSNGAEEIKAIVNQVVHVSAHAVA